MRGLEAWETKTARRLTRALRRAGALAGKCPCEPVASVALLKEAYLRILERATKLGWLTEEMERCPCCCHKPEPEGWQSVQCCPDCGATLFGEDENGNVVL